MQLEEIMKYLKGKLKANKSGTKELLSRIPKTLKGSPQNSTSSKTSFQNSQPNTSTVKAIASPNE